MNQDGLENYFGCVRSRCHNSSSLIAAHFRAAYASTFVTNFSSVHSMKSNCEQDISTPLLTKAHEFYLKYNNVVQRNDSNADDSIDDGNNSDVFDPLHNFTDNDFNVINSEAISYVSSSVCDKMLKIIKCSDCRETLEASMIDDTVNFEECDIPKQPSDLFNTNFRKLLCGMNDVLPDICAEKNLRKKLIDQLDKIEILSMGCSEHCEEVETNMKEQTAFYGIVTFTKNVNDLLSGKTRVLASNYNYVEELAFIFCQKNKKIGKHSDIFN